MPEPAVTIIGAGPAGLTLASYLTRHSIPCIIYEADASPHARAQGGTLDLHDDTGLRALRETGLLEAARGLMRAEGEAMRILDDRGRVWWDETGEREMRAWAEGEGEGAGGVVGDISGRPEIDRTDLRNLLLSSVPNVVQWDHAVRSVRTEPDAGGEVYVIEFKNGSEARTRILVGADGTWSRVRPLLHSTRPAYSGMTMFDTDIEPTHMTRELRAVVGPGAAMILADGKGVMSQMNAGGKCKVYAALLVGEDWLEENPLPAKGRRDYLKNMFPGWAHVHDLFDAVDEESVTPRRIYEFDPELAWTTERCGVTVIGDAAHVMSPFAGEGVNQAMADAIDLGFALLTLLRPRIPLPPPFPLTLIPTSLLPSPPRTPTSEPVSSPTTAALHAALRAFEAQMMARARPEMAGSKENMALAFGPDAAQRFAAFFRYMPFLYVGRMVMAPVWWVAGLVGVC